MVFKLKIALMIHIQREITARMIQDKSLDQDLKTIKLRTNPKNHKLHHQLLTKVDLTVTLTTSNSKFL